ncbi:hypothetical protein [Intestinibacter sp.]|uniref:hypothetical protein n=1 Tax=Intestinibacter sp. TaxID=1965304 RepID=UPI002A908B0A|nr:hypothetical protein [Intestinibacter sp.]MDY5213140.1 hypothetical protein [Intestinibacter sp.]
MGLFDDFEIVDTSNFCYYNKPGVWAMFGVPKFIDEEKYVCLNVGKSKCMGKELHKDYQRMSEFSLFKAKRYVNQFNRMKFSYPQFATRQDYLYKEIVEKYKSIVTVIITDNAENTYTVEKYFAYTTESEYWVSNGNYNSNTIVDSSRINEIRKGIDISQIDKGLIERIDSFGEKYKKQKPTL